MTIGDIYGCRRGNREEGEEPVCEHRIQPVVLENEPAEAGRDSRTCLARPNSQARTGTGKYLFSLFS